MASQGLIPDHRELIEILNKHHVEFLVVGGWAVIAHGYARLTIDMDFFVRKTPDNAQRLYLALEEFFGCPPPGIEGSDDFLKWEVVQFGSPPHRVDFVTRLDGIDFDEARKRGEKFPFVENCFYLHLDDLIRNKLASGRKKDLADAEVLQKIKERRGEQACAAARPPFG